jgi:hypothetical protein
MAADPTPYPEINALLNDLLSRVQQLLGKQFVGLYLYGSLASGDFDVQRSDIDFVAVTASVLPAQMLPALASMHQQLAAMHPKWTSRLEGSYVPQQALRRYHTAQAHYPALRMDGSFDVDHHGPDWVIHLYMIREHGIALAGPDPKTLIDPIQPDDLRHATLATLREWWTPMLDDPTRLRQRQYQAYAVLTMCRALYTLQHGAVVSKEVAARWAQSVFGEQWQHLIEEALAWPRGPQPDRLEETLALIRHTIYLARQFGP